ncbi:MAG: T9SS type A sorting domain-containing protein [Bacteroidales bacterium]
MKAKVYLTDLLNGKTINLNAESKYTFVASPEDVSNRFMLTVIMGETMPISYKTTNADDIHVYAQNKVVYISLPEDVNGDILVFDIMGQLIAESQGVGNSLNSIPVKANPGVYIVKIVNDNTIFSEKVFLK